MPQNKATGARANKYGKDTARRVGAQIGATSLSDRSNEFAHDGRLVTIHCARTKTLSVGVVDSVLERVNAVIGAFEFKKRLRTPRDVAFSISALPKAIPGPAARWARNPTQVRGVWEGGGNGAAVGLSVFVR